MPVPANSFLSHDVFQKWEPEAGVFFAIALKGAKNLRREGERNEPGNERKPMQEYIMKSDASNSWLSLRGSSSGKIWELSSLWDGLPKTRKEGNPVLWHLVYPWLKVTPWMLIPMSVLNGHDSSIAYSAPVFYWKPWVKVSTWCRGEEKDYLCLLFFKVKPFYRKRGYKFN